LCFKEKGERKEKKEKGEAKYKEDGVK